MQCRPRTQPSLVINHRELGIPAGAGSLAAVVRAPLRQAPLEPARHLVPDTSDEPHVTTLKQLREKSFSLPQGAQRLCCDGRRMRGMLSIRASALAAACALLGVLAPSAGANKALREPTVSTAGFAKVVDAPICAKVNERVYVPPHWVTARYQGRPVRIWLPGQTRVITVVRCHLRVVTRRVKVGGHWTTERIVLHPYVVEENAEQVPYGTATTVIGSLRTAVGAPVGYQRVEIWTAPDNGLRQFSESAIAVTNANGTWSARLPAGPSRLVASVYRGATRLTPSISPPAYLLVPAPLTLMVDPRFTHWGGTITITGRLRGGYIPRYGEVVVLSVGWPGGSAEIGHVYTSADGRFTTHYTFLRGSGTETYQFWGQTANETDYPYTPNRSPKVAVTVNP